MEKDKIEYKISLFFSKIFDLYYVFVTVPYLCYLSENNNNKRILVFLNFIFFNTVNAILKILINRDRPCRDMKELDYCPKDNDIPSGHSLSGIYFSLFLLKNEKKKNIIRYIIRYICILPLILQPFFRYILKVHSIEGSIFGSLIGILSYLFYFLIKERQAKDRLKKEIHRKHIVRQVKKEKQQKERPAKENQKKDRPRSIANNNPSRDRKTKERQKKERRVKEMRNKEK